ncbi:hypothetical protein [Oricola indica]|uniref:hypothetical protein n=1 Tax=Oricola indica TaxID=2872591 RepID=UPI003CCBBF88
MKHQYPLSALIERRLDELCIRRADLVRRMGYANVNKGMRRFGDIMNGDMRMAAILREKLAMALEVDIAIVDEAIAETRAAVQDEADRRYRASFKPHAVILTERTIPSPIFAAAFVGVDRLLRIDFDEGSSPVTFVKQVVRQLPEGVPAFGLVTGFVVNYSPDHAVVFDRDGDPVAELDEAVRIGQANVSVGGRSLSV